METADIISFKKKQNSFLKEIAFGCFSIIFSMLIFKFPVDKIIDFHKYAIVIYLIPVIPLFGVFFTIYKWIQGDVLTLNKKLDTISRNHIKLTSFQNVVNIEWNVHNLGQDDEGFSLDLKTKDNQTIYVSKNASFNAEHQYLGKKLATFFEVEFINNHPFEDRLIYNGKYNEDSNKLANIQNDY